MTEDYSQYCADGCSVQDTMASVSDTVALRCITFTPEISQNNPTVVFVAGWITQMIAWTSVLKEMTKDFQVVYVETREKKSSRVPAYAEHSIPVIAGDLVHIVDTLPRNDSGYILFGSSLGATVIIEGYHALNRKPAAVVLVSPNAVFRVPQLWKIIVAGFYPPLYRLIKPFVKFYLKHFRLDVRTDRAQYEKYSSALDSADPWKLKKAVMAVSEYSIWKSVPTVDCPVLLIGASKDTLHEPENFRKIASMIPHGEVVDLETNANAHSPIVVEKMRRYLGTIQHQVLPQQTSIQSKEIRMSKIKIILNPTAGMRSAESKIPLIDALMKKYNLDFTMELTQRVGHAAEIAERIDPAEHPIVVAAGGDGTCNEVFNGLMKAKNSGRAIPAMGAFPIGRGNDFSYGMGLPHDMEENIKILAAGRKKFMDVGKVTGGRYPEGRYFGNGIGVGFSTIVSLEAAKLKFIHGFLTYIVGAVKTLFLYYHAPQLRIELDDRVIDQRSIEASVMIGKRFGGAFFMAPDSLNDDGLFSLCIANNAPRLEMVKLMGKYMKGTQHGSKYISKHLARKVILTALDGFLAVHADGEIVCEKGERIELECYPRQIEIITK